MCFLAAAGCVVNGHGITPIHTGSCVILGADQSKLQKVKRRDTERGREGGLERASEREQKYHNSVCVFSSWLHIPAEVFA